MNGAPTQITVSIALSKRFCIEDLEQFYDGLKLACEPVSYTHLDVYKIQALHSPILQKEPHQYTHQTEPPSSNY